MPAANRKRYVALLLLVALLPLAAVVGFVLLVDPYGIFGAPVIEGFNARKTTLVERPHVFKIVDGLATNPRAVVLGSSRADEGIDPAHPGLLQPAYNFGYGGHTWLDSLYLLEQLLARPDSRLTQVVLHVDDFNTNAALLRNPPLARTTRETASGLGMLVSADTRRDAWKTIMSREGEPTPRYHAGFMRAWKPDYGQHSYFTRLEPDLVRAVIFIKGQCASTTRSPAGEPMAVLERVLALAYARKLDLRIVIGPSHARNWELVGLAGRWPVMEQWKRDLVAMNERLAGGARVAPFPLWDFSGFNRVTTEPVPPAEDHVAHMRWHLETSHFSPEAGAIMLDRVFGKQTVAGNWDDVGVELSPANVEAHLAQQRAARLAWRAANPADVGEVRAALATARDSYGCKVPVEP